MGVYFDRRFQPTDATTNPSLLYKAAQIEEYAHLVQDAIDYGQKQVHQCNSFYPAYYQSSCQWHIRSHDQYAVRISIFAALTTALSCVSNHSNTCTMRCDVMWLNPLR